MSRCDWIVCERTGRWAAALRRAVMTSTANPAARQRLREVRTLDELSAILAEQLYPVVLIEVRPSNLASVLAWLPDARRSYQPMRCLALLEDFDRASRDDVAAALRAAGAVEICESPRQIQRVVAIGVRHHAALHSNTSGLDAHQSITDWAWHLLPWQPAERQVG